MKPAHLILAHSQPKQLEQLIRKLNHPDADFYIHIDAKVNIGIFHALKQYVNVYFIKKRVKVSWGSYSIVQATINGFKEILSSNNEYDFINLLSGQDYPLKDTDYIHEYLNRKKGFQFMEFYSVTDQWHEAIPRITKYHFADYNIPGRYKLEKIINAITPERKMPQNLIPVGRSQWFTITTDAAKYIIEYLKNHPDVKRFFKLTWAPDELVFQTILYNSPYKHNMVNDNLRFIDWSEGKPSPRTFTINDMPALQQTEKLFARKFNMDIDENVFTKIDQANAIPLTVF